MTRGDAITILDCERPYGSCGCGATDEEIEEALDMAIEALEQKPCDKCVYSTSEGCQYVEQELKALPPFNPQKPKTGHWIVNEWGNISCSECGCTALYDKVYPGESVFGKAIQIKTTFCPTCGAKMVEPQERSDKE